MDFKTIDLINTNLYGDNFDEKDPETITNVILMAWRNRLKQRKACKNKNKQRNDISSMAANKMMGLVHVKR